jgi:cellulose synthase/poly-beta-1,6-N-acetylglucosamine synthase-like glycosyltransferase
MIYLEILLGLIAVLLFIPTLVILVQVLCACLPKARTHVMPASAFNHTGAFNHTSTPNIAVLIPAHNESSGIINSISSIKSQLKLSDRLLVVADNCSDDTAEVALENGAEVIERHDAARLGKGFALDFGIRHLQQNPPHIVVIIDADCSLQANSLSCLAALALQGGRPVQALDMMYAKSNDIKSKIAEFAWCVKNQVRPLGYAKLGLPCQLMGTGMAFPWGVISNANTANDSIVEDMQLGIALSKAGTPPIFYSGAQVTSYFPLAHEAQSKQRTRWEHGHLATILAETPRLLLQGILKRDINLLAIALDLAVPPLALLAALLVGYLAATGLAITLWHTAHLAFQITLSALVILTLAIAIAWLGWGRNIIPISAIFQLPVYVVSKIPHYFKFLFKRQQTWNKTERD